MRSLLLTFAFLILASPLLAEQDNNVSLTIRLVDDAGRFHVGEVIRIELSFTASIPAAYDIESRNYDRSGRLDIEQFHVTPPGRDPLEKYYSFGAFVGGGLGGPRELSGEPRILREDLNEWVALDEPGHYSLYVTSGRVSRRGPSTQEPLQLRSNSVEFDVVSADPAWQYQKLSAAVTTLNMDSTTEKEKAAALRVLRFLDTPDSVKELVHLLGTRPDFAGFDALGGLAGSRNESLVVSELEEQMAAPDIAVNANYLHILARLKFQLNHELPPPYPEKNPERQKIWTGRREKEYKELADLQDTLYERTAALEPSKQGKARAETAQTLLERPSTGSENVKPISTIPGDEVAATFLDLSQDEQWALLSGFWERLRVPVMVIPLKKIAEQPNIQHQLLRDVALRCLYDLDPSEAAPIFLQEIRHPHLDNGMFSVKGETLGLLPNQTLPQFDEMLSARIARKDSHTLDLDAQLVGRFSTKAILTTVKAVYETSPGKWDCIAEDGFVLYFLRVDPDYGVKRLAVAPSACMTNSLPAVIRMKRWNEMEPGIIAGLNGPDLNRARQAAETLAQYGSPQAEKAVWDRLRRFHAQWGERENELTDRPGMKSDANEAMGFQFGLVEAIGKAQAWLLTDQEITELEGLTWGQEWDNVKQWHWSSPLVLQISFFGEQIIATINNQYSMRDLASLQGKLAQYPEGTHFALHIIGPARRTASVAAAIDEIAAERGFQVDSSQPNH